MYQVPYRFPSAQGKFKVYRYIVSYKQHNILRWCRARDLFGSKIPVSLEGFELWLSCIRSKTHGLGNYFVYKRFAVQTLLWTLGFVIQIIHDPSGTIQELLQINRSVSIQELVQINRSVSIHHKNIQTLTTEVFKVSNICPAIMKNIFWF